jgi:hypothetical protein
MASGIEQLKEAMTPQIMGVIMNLRGSSLGFRTDRDWKQPHEQYSLEVVKECAIEAILRGAQLVGNEFNIISERCYLTKEFFVRALREFPGLSDLEIGFGQPKSSPSDPKVAYVAAFATWNMRQADGSMKPFRLEKMAKLGPDGKTVVEDWRIPVRVNADGKGGMQGPDAILGKAERKMRAAIYNLITGSAISELDDDEPPRRTIVVEKGETHSQTLANRLAAGGSQETVVDPIPQDSGNAEGLEKSGEESQTQQASDDSQTAGGAANNTGEAWSEIGFSFFEKLGDGQIKRSETATLKSDLMAAKSKLQAWEFEKLMAMVNANSERLKK